MVIDDEPTQRLAVTLMCRALNLPPAIDLAEADAALAMIAAKQTTIDLVICDLDMPAMDGMEFIRRLAKIPAPPAMMILSGHPSELLDSVEGLGRARGLRMMASVKKPLTKSVLVEVLEALAAETDRVPVFAAAPYLKPPEIDALIDTGGFEPYFQPQINLANGEVHGAEILARLVLPDGSIYMPAVFLERLVDRNLMASFTMEMVDKTLASVACWPDGIKRLHLSVNLTPALFEDLTIMRDVMARIDQSGLPRSQIMFELVETAVSGDPMAFLEGATRLRLRGYGLSIDDFGQGNSTLDQLRRLPFTELKIDRAFISRIDTDLNNQAIVSNTISMAKALGMTVVAEGVETEDEARYLADLGCHFAQGYFYSQALASDRFVRFLEGQARV